MKSILISLIILVIQLTVYSQTANENFQCPKEISLVDFSELERGKPLIINISIDSTDKSGVKYIWKVDKGEIIDGQGTSSIKVSTKDEELLVTSVKIEGLHSFCQNEITANLLLPHRGTQPVPFYAYEKISREEEIKQFDRFYKGLIKEKYDKGVILFISDNSKDLISRIGTLVSFLNSNNYDKSRLVIFISDTDYDHVNKMWFTLGEMPDCGNCEKIDLATYVKDIQNLVEKGYIFEETEYFEDN